MRIERWQMVETHREGLRKLMNLKWELKVNVQSAIINVSVNAKMNLKWELKASPRTLLICSCSSVESQMRIESFGCFGLCTFPLIISWISNENWKPQNLEIYA